jgi:quercetin dioxygenase-like cupin family protein
MKIVQKPWGYELWFAYTDKYAGKLIILKKGHKSSLQYHKVKHETLYLDSGLLKLTMENENHNLIMHEFHQGEAVVVPPNTKHRMEAIEDSRIIEVSTPELDDVVRVEDAYGRTQKG